MGADLLKVRRKIFFLLMQIHISIVAEISRTSKQGRRCYKVASSMAPPRWPCWPACATSAARRCKTGFYRPPRCCKARDLPAPRRFSDAGSWTAMPRRSVALATAVTPATTCIDDYFLLPSIRGGAAVGVGDLLLSVSLILRESIRCVGSRAKKKQKRHVSNGGSGGFLPQIPRGRSALPLL